MFLACYLSLFSLFLFILVWLTLEIRITRNIFSTSYQKTQKDDTCFPEKSQNTYFVNIMVALRSNITNRVECMTTLINQSICRSINTIFRFSSTQVLSGKSIFMTISLEAFSKDLNTRLNRSLLCRN